MDRPTKPLLMDLLRRARDAEEEFARGLGDEERAASGTRDSWSATYTLAHITAAKARLTRALGAARAGDMPSLAHDEEEVYREHHGRPWADVEDEARRVSAAFLEEVGRLSEAELADTGSQPWLEGRSMAAQIVGYGVWHPYSHLGGYYRQRRQGDRLTRLEQQLIEAVEEVERLPALHQDPVTLYNMACIYATSGRKDNALSLLEEALRLDPTLRDSARSDSDLESLRGNALFRELTAV
jgi:tetratricopeptide (TPR) repeat protein